ncbi:hypothetical protein DM860_004510 [Cuscuta australis]|uniref:Uncharacterized protein n=1 Tax=Cuscuta australis TaxID=267555 RepID=A0A328EBU2_9ASTE|nr:hypothetical protein DM860_004510 [Cuscuta australis]
MEKEPNLARKKTNQLLLRRLAAAETAIEAPQEAYRCHHDEHDGHHDEHDDRVAEKWPRGVRHFGVHELKS